MAERSSRGEVEGDGDGGELALVVHGERRRALLDEGEGGEGHLAGRRGPEVDLLQGLRALAEVGLHLQHHPVLVELGEDGRDLALAEGVVERVVDHLGRDAESGGGGAIDAHGGLETLILLVARHVAELGQCAEALHEPGRPGGELDEIRILQAVLVLRPAHAIFHGQVLDGLEIERDPADLGKGGAQAVDHRAHAHPPLVEGLQGDEHASAVERDVGAVDADEGRQRGHGGVRQDDLAEGLLTRGHGGERHGLRGIRDAKDHAGVLGREEPFGDEDVQDKGEREEAHGHEQGEALMLENAAQGTGIAFAKGLEDALGGPRESIGLGLRVVAEELGAEHRGQGQGDDGGDENGDAEGDGEFPEEAPHDVAHEEEGDEHGDEGDGQGENGEADLPRALEGRLQRRVARLDVAGDVLDHDHRVVDHEARGDGEGHQREVVQAEAQRVHDGEGADDRDGHGHARDEGGGGAAQEQEDDEHHEDHGEHELELDVVDRGANGGGAVRQHRDLHGGGQRALELRQELLHAIDHLDEVGPRLSLDIDDDGRTGAHPRRLPEVLGVVHRVGDVGEEHGGAVTVGDDERPVESTRHELIVGPDGIGLLGAV